MPPQPVRINVSPSITCNPDPVPVNKDVDTVQWSCSQSFTIKFNGQAPINATGSGSNWTASAGPWNNTTNEKKKLKYDVTVGTTTVDPEVEIQP
jgi:hypothetical protein